MASGSVEFVIPTPEFLPEGSPPPTPLVLEPVLEGDEFIHGYHASQVASPVIAVYVDGVKVGTCEPDFSRDPREITYPDGVVRPSWQWTLDLLALDPPVPVNRRSRITARAFVGQVFSDLSPEAIARTHFFKSKLLSSLPEVFASSDSVLDVRLGQLAETISDSEQRIALTAPPPQLPALPFTAYIGKEAVFVREVNDEEVLIERAREGTDPVEHRSGEALVRRVGPLSGMVRAIALTLDEMKDWADAFVESFDADLCDAKYLPYLAAMLGTGLSASTPEPLLRRAVKTAVAQYKVKGTAESFRMVFYSLGYRMRIYELWTTTGYPEYLPPNIAPPILLIQDDVALGAASGGAWRSNYKFFTETLPGYPAGTPADEVPQDDPLLIENGGRWYKSPHFAIELASIEQPNLTADALRHILATIHRIRPAHTVLEYIRYVMSLVEPWPLPKETYLNYGDLLLRDKGWYLGYCDPDDPVYFRSGINFPGMVFPTRDGVDAPAINMKREQIEGKCHPPETLDIIPEIDASEPYGIELRRDGMGIIPDSGDVDPADYDSHAWPWRDDHAPWGGETFDRSGRVRYLNTLTLTLLP